MLNQTWTHSKCILKLCFGVSRDSGPVLEANAEQSSESVGRRVSVSTHREAELCKSCQQQWLSETEASEEK